MEISLKYNVTRVEVQLMEVALISVLVVSLTG